MTIRESDAVWATRLNQYLSYGNPKLQWEQFAVAAIVWAVISLVFVISLCSALNRDDQAL